MIRKNLLILYFFLWKYIMSTRSTTSCMFFEMSTNTGENISTKENKDLNFTFTLNRKQCKSVTNIYLTVYKGESPMCSIRQKGDNCSASESSTCNCTSEIGVYQFTKPASRSDNTIWTWSALDWQHLTEGTQINVTFNVTYPANVKSLTVNGERGTGQIAVIQNKTVEVLCHWENGNPPTAARLVNNHGHILVQSVVSGPISHKIRLASCTDKGHISCEADRSERNVSVDLLVMCPPVFTNVSRETQYLVSKNYVDLSFPVHAVYITGCQLSKQMNQNNKIKKSSLTYQCQTSVTTRSAHIFPISNVSHAFERQGIKCWCSLLGTVPNMSMFIHISDLSVENNGIWTLNVSNPLGSDSVNISFRVSIESDENNFSEGHVLYSALGVIVVIVGVVSLAVFGKRKMHDQSRTNIPQTTTVYRDLDVQDDLQVQIGNEYDEIVGELKEPENMPNNRTISENYSTDYLHPVSENFNMKSLSESLQTIDSNSKTMTSQSSKSDDSGYLKPVFISEIDSSKYSTLSKEENNVQTSNIELEQHL